MYPSATHRPSPPAAPPMAPPAVQPPPSTTTRIPTTTAPPSTDIHFTGQPVFKIQQDTSQVPAKWSTGLCDCSDDIGNCCLTCLCPCVTFGRIAVVVDGGTTSCWASAGLYALIMCLTGWPCLYSCFYRSKLRGQHFLEETPCSDCLVHCCFEYCALCQEYRELKNRGLDDPRNGWQGPIVPPVAPVVEGRMKR